MTQLPAWVGKLQTVWTALGTFLTILVFQGVPLPEWVPKFISPETFETVIQAVTVLLTVYQYIRSIFIAAPPASLGVQTLSTERVNAFAFNPFKLRA